VLNKLVTIFKYQQQSCERRRAIHAMRNRLDRLYGYVGEKVGESAVVWHSVCEYNIEL
jgi:hypothetical protein